jgi:5-methylcytosine-specific restriction endonuclease McrA
MGKQAKWKEFSEEQIKEIVANATSDKQVAEALGYSRTGGGSMESIHKMYEFYNIDTSHFLGQGWNKNNFDYTRFQNGKAIKSANMVDALTALRGHKCEKCGLTHWLEKPITLEVHHKDGNHLNNELENLELLCPNCHSYTDNWRGKNIVEKQQKLKKEPVSDELLVTALKTHPSVRQALISVGLTGAGGNYDRAYNLIHQYNIEHLKK